MNQQSNNNKSDSPDDNILAILLEMFGDALSTNLIIKVGSQSNWDIDVCVEQLIRYSNDPAAVSLTGTVEKQQTTQNVPPLLSALENLKLAYSEPHQQLNSGVELVEQLEDEESNNDVDILIEREEIHGGGNAAVSTVSALDKQEQSYSKMLSSVAWPNNSTKQPTSSSSNSYSRGYNYRSVSTKPTASIGEQKFNQLIEAIRRGYKVMVLMRGAPGSGKSHLARALCDMTVLSSSSTEQTNYRNHIFSTDDYFLDARGRYCYNPSRIPEAHDWNDEKVRKFAKNQWSPIIVDNTNMKLWEMVPHVQTAIKNGYLVEFLDAYTPWCKSAGKLAMRNVHNVPKEKIQIILQKYEPTSVDDFLRSFNLRYLEPVPQVRSFPPLVLDNSVLETNNSNTEPDIDELDPNVQGIIAETIWDNNWDENNESIQHLPTIDPNCPKPERNIQTQRLITTTTVPTPTQDTVNYIEDDNDEPIKLPDKNIDWMKHENELMEFWNYNPNQMSTATSTTFQEKSSLVDQSTNDQHSKIFSILKKDRLQPSTEATTTADPTTSTITEIQSSVNNDDNNEIQVLNKHRKNCINENKSFAQIRQIYPDVPHPYLWDLFKNCNGDGDWTMDILLKEETTTGIYNANNNKSKEKFNDDKLNEEKYFNCLCDKQPLELTEKEEAGGIIDIPPITTTNTLLISNNNRRRKKNLQQLEETKRQIEESIVIGDEYYSEHSRKIRNIRHGNGAAAAAAQQSSPSPPPLPPLAVITDFSGAEAVVGGGIAGNEIFDEQIDNSSSEDDEILEIDLGIELIQQLDQSFGIDAFQNDSLKDLKTTVFMPKSFAQQLYAIWMESLYNQIEEQRQQSIKCDEEFARKLHEIEEYQEVNHRLIKPTATTSSTIPPATPTKTKSNIQDIIDMELAFAAYKSQKIEDSWKNPNDLASQMTINKLMELFPEIEKDTLVEVFQAHGNQFEETVLYLHKSKGITTHQQQVNNNLIMEQKRQELMAQAEAETEQVIKRAPFLLIVNHNNKKQNATGTIAAPPVGFNINSAAAAPQKLGCDESAKSAALNDFEDCRNMAQHHTQLKAECYRKAQDAIQKQNTSAALYYSQIANLHKVKIDLYNQKAANLIMEVHNLTQNNPDMLDLHYLHVAEAVQCLDIFLDHHIHRLITCRSVYRYILVITGRGLHSAGGFSTIKQRAKQRLKERGLKWTEVNPGLLKVKIHIQSRLSNDM